MSRLGGSTAVADQRVYAQATEPSDTRDGILWVDTSEETRPTFVYSSESGQFESIAPDPATAVITAGLLW